MRGLSFAVVVVAGCGGSTSSGPDAAVVDAGPDAAVVDAPPPDDLIQARITISVEGQVRAGERILVNRRDGSLQGEGTTDANGAFSAAVADGGSLTWVKTDVPIVEFYTFMELHDGDEINAGTPDPPPTAVTPIAITRTDIPNALSTTFGVDRWPDQTLEGATVSYPSTATGPATVIQNGVGPMGVSVGYATAPVTVGPGAAITMPATIHQANDLVVDVVAPVLEGDQITAVLYPFELADAGQARLEVARASGAATITHPRVMFAEVPYLSGLVVVFDTGSPTNETHITHRTIDSSVTHVSYGLADLARCPGDVVNNGPTVTIGQPPISGDFARYSLSRWHVTVPHTTTSFARIKVPGDLFAKFTVNQRPLVVNTVDSGDIGYAEALSLQRSTHYVISGYTGDGHPYKRECLRIQ